jgi:hypothetical protein
MKTIIITILLLAGVANAQTKAVTKLVNDSSITESLVVAFNKSLTIGKPESNSLGRLLITDHGQIELRGNVNGYNNSVISLLHQENLSGVVTFNGMAARLSAEADSSHAIMGRARMPWDGIGVIGWSSSGAAAVKAKQDTYFSSPALSVVRNLASPQEMPYTPALKIFLTDSSYQNYDDLRALPALSVENPSGGPAFSVSWDGTITGSPRFASTTHFDTTTVFLSGSQTFFNNNSTIVFGGNVSFVNNTIPRFDNGLRNYLSQHIDFTHARGWCNANNSTRLHPIYKGTSATALATGSLDTSMVGDTYFNTSDNRMYILTPNGWRAITAP